MTVALTITVTDAEYRRLAAIADAKQVNARHVAASIIRMAFSPDIRPAKNAEIVKGRKIHDGHVRNIIALNKAGMNDLQIAAETGIGRETVRRYRVALDLPRRDKAHLNAIDQRRTA